MALLKTKKTYLFEFLKIAQAYNFQFTAVSLLLGFSFAVGLSPIFTLSESNGKAVVTCTATASRHPYVNLRSEM